MQQRIAASILCVMCISSVILQLQAAVKAATSSYQHTLCYNTGLRLVSSRQVATSISCTVYSGEPTVQQDKKLY